MRAKFAPDKKPSVLASLLRWVSFFFVKFANLKRVFAFLRLVAGVGFEPTFTSVWVWRLSNRHHPALLISQIAPGRALRRLVSSSPVLLADPFLLPLESLYLGLVLASISLVVRPIRQPPRLTLDSHDFDACSHINSLCTACCRACPPAA